VSFDTIAPHYDRLERWFSRGQMHAARVAHLDQLPACRHALLLGEGPGRFLDALLERFPEIRCTCVDASQLMLDQAKSRLSKAQQSRVTFLLADARNLPPLDSPADLLVTNFFFDCFRAEELASLIRALASQATLSAHWLVADFQIPAAGWPRWRAQLIVGGLYRFFRFVTGLEATQVVPPAPLLEQAGFTRQERAEFEQGLVASDWWRR
jgi:ubiquinone/menaquinone biosynthesis C-methylase UbiE